MLKVKRGRCREHARATRRHLPGDDERNITFGTRRSAMRVGALCGGHHGSRVAIRASFIEQSGPVHHLVALATERARWFDVRVYSAHGGPGLWGWLVRTGWPSSLARNPQRHASLVSRGRNFLQASWYHRARVTSFQISSRCLKRWPYAFGGAGGKGSIVPFGGWRGIALITGAGSGAAGAIAAAAMVCATGGPPFSVPRTGPAAPFGSDVNSRAACAGKSSVNALLMSGSSCKRTEIFWSICESAPFVCEDVRTAWRKSSHLLEMWRSAPRRSTQPFRFDDDVEKFFIHSLIVGKALLHARPCRSCTQI